MTSSLEGRCSVRRRKESLGLWWLFRRKTVTATRLYLVRTNALITPFQQLPNGFWKRCEAAKRRLPECLMKSCILSSFKCILLCNYLVILIKYQFKPLESIHVHVVAIDINFLPLLNDDSSQFTK